MKLEIESEDEFYQKFHVIKSQESCCPQSRQAEGKIQLFDGHLTGLYMSMNYVEAKEIKKVVDEIIRAYEGLNRVSQYEGEDRMSNNVCIPLHFFRNVTLEQYQRFFEDCPVCASVGMGFEEFVNTGAYVMLDYYKEDHKALMKYIKKNSGIVEIDMETLAEMKD